MTGDDRADVKLEIPKGTPPDVREKLEALFEEFVALDLEMWRFRETLPHTHH